MHQPIYLSIQLSIKLSFYLGRGPMKIILEAAFSPHWRQPQWVQNTSCGMLLLSETQIWKMCETQIWKYMRHKYGKYMKRKYGKYMRHKYTCVNLREKISVSPFWPQWPSPPHSLAPGSFPSAFSAEDGEVNWDRSYHDKAFWSNIFSFWSNISEFDLICVFHQILLQSNQDYLDKEIWNYFIKFLFLGRLLY